MRRHSLQCSNIQLLHQQPTYLGSLSERQPFMHLIKYVAFRLSYSPYKKGSLIVTCLYGWQCQSVGWLVHHFWSGLKNCRLDCHEILLVCLRDSQIWNCNDYGDPQTYYLSLSSCQNFHLYNSLVYDQISRQTQFQSTSAVLLVETSAC